MLGNYFRIAHRNLLKNKFSSAINIGGLAAGMAVAILIGLWIDDECSFNKHFDNYDRLGKLWQNVKFDKVKASYDVAPIPIAAELLNKYPEFQAIGLASQNAEYVISVSDKHISDKGAYVQPSFVSMLSLQLIAGDRHGLDDPHGILLSQTLARTLFGEKDPMGRTLLLANSQALKVAGIYRDFPSNTNFNDYHFLGPWDAYVAANTWVKQGLTDWDNNSFQVFTQLKPGASFAAVSGKIKETRMLRSNPPGYHPEFFVFPMSRWHLYGDFYDGVNIGGLITFVWLFGIIGIFVLLLACINFMNLSTARSERRAKEVGIRKAIGSLRIHLIAQFLSESVMVALIAFVLATLLAWLALPLFNEIAGKKMTLPWENNTFWLAGIGFSILTGLIAGSYPALYLSSFRPVKVLKGTFKAGRLASIPRKILVTLQFSVSVALIIGTLVVLRQIGYAKDRSLGYDRHGLIEMNMNTQELFDHARAIQTALLNSGAVENLSAGSSSLTSQDGGTTDISWQGKTPDQHPLVQGNQVTPEFGKTVNWQMVAGRDFSRAFGTDSAAIILNQTAVKLMGLAHPLGETITRSGKPYHVIGVMHDMVRNSPFRPVDPTYFILGREIRYLDIRLSQRMPIGDALTKIAAVFHQYNPASPFTYTFVDDDFAKKFDTEERVGKLAGFFATLAIFISRLGLYGLVSFVAEQRTREIGMRKILGASVFNVWKLLSKEFLILVTISLLIAIPVAWYFMRGWLLNYDYRAPLSWWIFAAAGTGALAITLITISVEAIKAALANPIKSLRTE
jgi:putative ABC transport system permease protein